MRPIIHLKKTNPQLSNYRRIKRRIVICVTGKWLKINIDTPSNHCTRDSEKKNYEYIFISNGILAWPSKIRAKIRNMILKSTYQPRLNDELIYFCILRWTFGQAQELPIVILQVIQGTFDLDRASLYCKIIILIIRPIIMPPNFTGDLSSGR